MRKPKMMLGAEGSAERTAAPNALNAPPWPEKKTSSGPSGAGLSDASPRPCVRSPQLTARRAPAILKISARWKKLSGRICRKYCVSSSIRDVMVQSY